MAPQRNGVFAGFDLQNATSIIEMVNALRYFRGGGRNRSHGTIRILNIERQQTIRNIIREMRLDEDLRVAVEALLEADGDMVEAAEGLAAYAVAEANVTSRPRFEVQSPERPRPLFGAVGRTSTAPRAFYAQRRDDEENETMKRNEETARKLLQEEMAFGQSTPRKTLPGVDDRSASFPQIRPQYNETSTATTSTSGYNAAVITPVRRSKPSLQRHYECYDDGNVNREAVKWGQPDPSKFTIWLPSRKPDPKNPDKYIEGKGATYNYPHQKCFDWYDNDMVKRLHQWREQIFRRRIGGVRPTRPFWIESEKSVALEMMQQQLERHHRVQWKKLANRFNTYHQGRIQRKGQIQVFAGKKKDGGILEEDRTAPWRTASAIEGQAWKWAEYHELMENKRREDDKSVEDDAQPSSDDEAERQNPVPTPTTFAPRKSKPWKKPATKPRVTKNKPQLRSTSIKNHGTGEKRKRDDDGGKEVADSDDDLSPPPSSSDEMPDPFF